jgi:alkaline phosphatase D
MLITILPTLLLKPKYHLNNIKLSYLRYMMLSIILIVKRKMLMKSLSRRDFLVLSARGAGAAVISYGLMGCDTSNTDTADILVSFEHGIASGDPLNNAIILWTRITPASDGDFTVSWEVAEDENFTELVTTGSTTTNADSDYTVKIDAIGLTAGTSYYYRFNCNDISSDTGKTKTLVDGSPSSVKLAVMSCANYPAGFFNVYNLVVEQDDLDAVLHLGDYIYEYARGEYASENAEALDRQVLPATELFSLSDYRTRYAQYRSDADLQSLHMKVPFITVWDDHEVANDTWSDGAENHSDDEGDFNERKLAALQAYFEWLPIRPWTEDNYEEIYRSFAFGDLVDLHMLDTRVLARDEQLDYADYFDYETNVFNETDFNTDLYESDRNMLGTEQLQWLEDSVNASTATWQVLGQQVLMAEMKLAGAIALGVMSSADYATLGALALLAARYEAGDPSLTDTEIAYLSENSALLTEEVITQLSLPSLPYNLDAWDGYSTERDKVLEIFNATSKNLVVLAGDTHNAWASDLSNADDTVVGVEFATSSVSSPGLEYYLGITDDEAEATEEGLVSLVNGLKYVNATNRGFLTVTFTPAETQAEWHFVDTILSTEYSELNERQVNATTIIDNPGVILS